MSHEFGGAEEQPSNNTTATKPQQQSESGTERAQEMATKSPSTNSSTTTPAATTTTQSSGQPQQQASAGAPAAGQQAVDAAQTAAVDQQQQQQQSATGPGRPASALGQQHPQQQQQPYPQQRWPPEAMPPPQATAGTSPAATPGGGMMLSSPHYPPPQHQHQYTVHQQHLGVPSPSPYGYPAGQPAQQHSPNSRPYPPPPPQMLHPAMMYSPHGAYVQPGGGAPSPYGHPAHQQYWAAARSAPNGQQPGMMGPPPPQHHYPVPPQQQPAAQQAQHETPSTSRTPQPAQSQQQQMPQPSPSAASSHHDDSMEENNTSGGGGHRPRSSQSQFPQQQQQMHAQGQPQQPPPQMRYPAPPPPNAMLPPQIAGQPFQPPPMVVPQHHAGIPQHQLPPHMQAPPGHPHHMGPPPMQMHPGAQYSGHPHHPGMYFPPPPHHPAAGPPPGVAMHPHHPQHQQQQMSAGILPGIKPAQREAVDKLVMQLANPKQQLTPEMVYERRLFFERLVLLNEQRGEILSAPPQVSKSTVDLFALFFAVKKRGGFEKTIRDKIWKNLCTDANIDMQQSSAAGFQLRKHYQKFLLKLECLENGLNEKDLIEFAEKQKKKKKEKEPAAPATPSSSSSMPAAGGGKEEQQHNQPKVDQHQQQQRQTANGPPPPPFQGYPQGMALPPGAGGYPPGSAAEFAGPPPTSGYPQPGPPHQFGQYPPPPQWAYQQQMAAQQQGMYAAHGQRVPPGQMRPGYPGQQQPEDEQQKQQRLATSSRLSSTSTPAPGDHPSRASSVMAQQQEKLDAREDDAAQRQAAQTPSGFSANAPTPPLTTSSTSAAAHGPQGATPQQQQQQQMPPGYYPSPYGRYPPQGGPQPGEMYAGAGPPPPGMYPPGQQPMWGTPYAGMPPQHQRYHHPGASMGRYPPYATAGGQPPQVGAVPAASNSPQQQQAVQASQQQSGTPKAPKRGGAPAGMVGAAPGMLLPPYVPQPPQQFPAWFGSATMCTQPSPFPPQSVEAQTVAQLPQQQQMLLQQQRYRRPKVWARDLQGVTPTRIVMALRSGLHLEACWALNALNIQLHDDTTPNAYPSLVQTPELLGLLVEHLAAALMLLFPGQFESWRSSSPFQPSQSKAKNTTSTTNSNQLLVPKHEPTTTSTMSSESIALMVRPPQAAPVLTATTSTNSNGGGYNKKSPNFTMVSRLGRRVKLDSAAEIPPELARELAQTGEEEHEEETESTDDFMEFVQRIRRSMLEHVVAGRALQKLVRFKQEDGQEERKDFWEESTLSEEEDKTDLKEEIGIKKEEQDENAPNGPRLFYSRPKSWEHWDRHSMAECALLSRQTVLQNAHTDELMAELVDRCLALSNCLRGFSFLPGQERQLAQHKGLLRLLPTLIMLMVDEGIQRKKDVGNLPTTKQFSFPRPPPECEKGEEEKAAAITAQRPSVPAEQDSRRKWLLEVANQLRDDAFTILAHISPNLDLFDWESSISWPILDCLLHWSVCTELQARDPLPPFGAIPPRHYALEVLCKMSVLERNVDLMVSTGPWARLEEFVRLLCSLICEEPPVREFAIVILNAVCTASEPACWVAAEETSLLEHLVSFLEAADANMTQIAQHQGIHTLRENPEIIGTSVGMLRRAALIMVQIVRHPGCRRHFQRLQHRLLQFTVSHFMDSRVAAMVADILFEMQRGEQAAKGAKKEEQCEEQPAESKESDQECRKYSLVSQVQQSTTFSTSATLTESTELLFNGGGPTTTAENGIGGDCTSRSSAHSSQSTGGNTDAENNNNGNHQQQKKNNRKRPSKSGSPTEQKRANSNHNSGSNDEQLQLQSHANWNGHSHHHHHNNESSDRKTKKSAQQQQQSPQNSTSTTVGESVRERMRNNILGKAAQHQQKKNGWICEDNATGEPLQNGTSPNAATGTAATTTNASSDAGNGSSSLTAVA